MSKVKMADTVGFYICEDCTSVHIVFVRNGRAFAEAIPMDIDAVAADLAATIAESKALAMSKARN